MTKTVVILLSDKRSGSTIFQRELCKHSNIQTVAYSPHTYLETHHWLKAAVMLGIDPALFSGGTVYSGYGTRQNARTYMEDCLCQNLPDFKIPADDRALVFEGWEALCDRFTQPIFFEKSPQFLAHWGCLELMLEWIEQTNFQVKVIGLVRNPLSVMYSAQELFYTDPETRQYGWVEIYENLTRFQTKLSPAQFMLCRYEDIIQQPVSAFAEVCQFIGVSSQAQVGLSVHDSSANKWETDPFFTLQLASPVKAMAQKLGYSEAGLNNPPKPRPPLIYRLRRAIEGNLKLLISRVKNRLIAPTLLRLKQTYRY